MTSVLVSIVAVKTLAGGAVIAHTSAGTLIYRSAAGVARVTNQQVVTW